MLNPVTTVRHLAVGGAMLVGPVLVLAGVLGGGVHDERFDAKQVLVTPEGDGVRIREVVDQDFGNNSKHGYERVIRNDFGVPTDVTASSPDAPDAVSVSNEGNQTRIRIGDPGTTIDGQHRYVLTYTLPEARLSTGQLALDIIDAGEEFETGRFEVVLAGFDLTDPLCNVGARGTSGGCDLVRDGDVYRVVFEPLKAADGVTVGGTIAQLSTPADVPVPAVPPRRQSNPVPLALGVGGLGLAAGVGGYALARRLGRNEVSGVGPADAAYAGGDTGPTRLVTDKALAAMATTEFEPPRGIRPWQGALLLDEAISSGTVSAWFSDQIAQQVVELRGEKSSQVLVPGPHLAEAPPITRQRFETLFDGEAELALGTYQPRLSTLWKEIEAEQKVMAAESAWWKKFPPGTIAQFPPVVGITVVVLAVVVGIGIWRGWLHSWPIALAFGIAIPAVVAGAAYRGLLPVRSAIGSAMALRAESFRRFLEASEGTHVDWAWSHGLLREYSAWAVALGAADAWGRAVSASAVPPADAFASTTPLLLYANAGLWNSTRTPPQSSGSGGGGFGGGFSGGSVGGGGGGGSSGSW